MKAKRMTKRDLTSKLTALQLEVVCNVPHVSVCAAHGGQHPGGEEPEGGGVCGGAQVHQNPGARNRSQERPGQGH